MISHLLMSYFASAAVSFTASGLPSRITFRMPSAVSFAAASWIRGSVPSVKTIVFGFAFNCSVSFVTLSSLFSNHIKSFSGILARDMQPRLYIFILSVSCILFKDFSGNFIEKLIPAQYCDPVTCITHSAVL